MKKSYAIKNQANKNLTQLILLTVVLLGMNFISYSQVRVPFTPRTSLKTPDKTIYNVKGDFTMIGNTNLTLRNYSHTTDNSNSDMIYVDVDGDTNTYNSSSATLTFSTEHGADPACSNVIYAGLYWSGRNHLPSDPMINRRTVKFKGPGQSYQSLVSELTDIRFPGVEDDYMFVGYKEVTDLVKSGGMGEYFVADIRTSYGNGGEVGFYGGWGMVVVYENSEMDRRDVTIFDGFAYVKTGLANTLDVSGFKTVQSGNVNIKLGMMAGEGDVGLSGDYFQILNRTTNLFQNLSHSGNTTTNFFNSSIQTGGNLRNPNLRNNTGMDISMFNLNNPGNTIIGNNQTSTKFKYGTNLDRYIIFNIAFSVAAYIPEAEALLSVNSIKNVPVTIPPYVVEPGDNVEYKVQLRNRGTEAIRDGRLVIPIPYTAQFVPGSINFNQYDPLFQASPPYFSPTEGPIGSIVWDITRLPLNPGNLNTVLADITFKLTTTTDCSILMNDSCPLRILMVDGIISGTGATSGTVFSVPVIQGYEQSGTCQEIPTAEPIEISVDADQYIIDNCAGVSKEKDFLYCDYVGSTIPVSAISGDFVPGSTFYDSFPVTGTSIQYDSTNPFPATNGIVTYYAIPPGNMDCYYVFTIEFTNITSTPVVANDVFYCLNETAVPLLATPTSPEYIVLYYTDNDPNTLGVATLTPLTDTAGTFTYYAAEGRNASCVGDRVSITVKVYDAPLITAPAGFSVEGCSGQDVIIGNLTALAYSEIPVTITEAEFLSEGGTFTYDSLATITYQDSSAGSCPIIVTRTFTIKDACQFTATNTQTITINSPAVIVNGPVNLSAGTCDYPSQTEIDNAFNTWLSQFNVSGGCNATGDYGTPTAPLLCNGGITTVTYTVTDLCNPTSIVRTFTIAPPASLVITSEASDIIVECDGTGNNGIIQAWLNTNGGATVSDNCTAVTWTNNYGGSIPDCSVPVEVIFTATDACGISVTTTASYSIEDTIAPVMTSANDETVECDGNGNINELNAWLTNHGGATATDDCSAIAWSHNFTGLSDGCGETGFANVTFTATDGCGNASSVSAVFTIVDTTAPIITPAIIETVECDGNGNITALNAWLANHGGATATDDCSAIAWSHNFTGLSDGCGETGFANVTFTATDDCGNASSVNAIFAIVDTTAPVITPASNETVECDGNGNITALNAWLANNGGATATDACSAIITWSNNFTVLSDGCGETGSANVTFTATDDCGNAISVSAVFTIVDTTAPAITPASNETVECDGNGNITELNAWLANNGGATATDACSAIITWSHNFTGLSDGCGETGSANVTFTATDDCGNTSSVSAVFTIEDTIAPVTPNPPADITYECLPDVPTGIVLTAIDNCAGNIIGVVSDIIDNSDSCEIIITRTWTFTDPCNNSSTVSQIIKVIDTTAPIVTNDLSDKTVNCDAVPEVPVLIFDDCSNMITTTDFNEHSTYDGTNNDYEIIWTWKFRDPCDNYGTASQIIYVKMTENVIFENDSRCIEGGIIDLFDYYYGSDTTGTWTVVSGDTTLDGQYFDPLNVPYGDYVFSYTGANSHNTCFTTTEVTININDDCVAYDCGREFVVISKAVTPNGDQWNEYFEITGVEFCRFIMDVKIFNRWGAMIYESKNYQNDWNGTASKGSIGNADKVPNGTYYYILTIKNSDLKPFTGHIYLGTK